MTDEAYGGAVDAARPAGRRSPGWSSDTRRPSGYDHGGGVSPGAASIVSAAVALVARIIAGLSPMSWPPEGPARLRPPDVAGDERAGRT